MKMRVYGFGWVPKDLPPLVPAANVFDRIAAVSGVEFGDRLSAITKIDDWWVGILLKIRNAKAFTKLRRNRGVLTVSSETLPEGEQLAETNFFIAHKSNGHGLYCHHHMSASLLGDFAYYCHHRFTERVRELLAPALAATSVESQRRRINAEYKGHLVLEQILKPGSFDAHVSKLKEITELEANLVSYEVKDSDFQPLERSARRKRISIGFDPSAHMGEIARAIVQCRKKGFFEKAKVTGRDAAGHEQIYKTLHDAQVFEEYEYDQMVGSLSVSFDDLPGSIRASEITKRLLALVSDVRVRRALNIS